MPNVRINHRDSSFHLIDTIEFFLESDDSSIRDKIRSSYSATLKPVSGHYLIVRTDRNWFDGAQDYIVGILDLGKDSPDLIAYKMAREEALRLVKKEELTDIPEYHMGLLAQS